MVFDHVVLWVENVKRSLKFYIDVLGLKPVRVEAFENGTAPFPSVRLNETTIFDLMERKALLHTFQDMTGGESNGGAPVNHLCLSMSALEYHEILERLVAAGVQLNPADEGSFGAQGHAIESAYFSDPDNNILEIRYYK